MQRYFETENLAVGYDGRVLIRDISLGLERGKICTLVGPNGAGKSTILKTISRQLQPIRGTVYLDRRTLGSWSARELARRTAVVLTDRVRPELMTCAEVVAMGRYPYTGLLGKLSAQDRMAVEEALDRVHATDIAGQDFATLSDGQRQRILLARAICQEPEVLILDEPTAYLDIRYKLELLDILRNMARQGVTVILSLHEIDLAMKLSDYLVCVKGETIAAFGPPETVLQQDAIQRLYELPEDAYNTLLGSVELGRPQGEPRVFVVAGDGQGIACYRALQRREIPFATGILYRNDVDSPVARALSRHVVEAPPFEPMGEPAFSQAAELLVRCETVIDAGTPLGSCNQANARLLAMAAEKNIPIRRWKEEGL